MRPKKPTARPDNIGDDLIASMEEALAFTRGEPTGVIVREITPADVKAVRRKLGLSQPGFADLISTPLPTVQKWEQGKRRPSGAALTLLRLIVNAPEFARRVLSPAP